MIGFYEGSEPDGVGVFERLRVQIRQGRCLMFQSYFEWLAAGCQYDIANNSGAVVTRSSGKDLARIWLLI
jgi:hypothetical protein